MSAAGARQYISMYEIHVYMRIYMYTFTCARESEINSLSSWNRVKITRCNKLQHAAIRCNMQIHSLSLWNRVTGSVRGILMLYCPSYHSISRHAATRCNTLQHAATRCNTLQHAAIRCNMLQHTHSKSMYCPSNELAVSLNELAVSLNELAVGLNELAVSLQHFAVGEALCSWYWNDPHAATHHNALQHAATRATRCNTLQHVAAHCNTSRERDTLNSWNLDDPWRP